MTILPLVAVRETPREHCANAAQICRLALDQGRTLTFAETGAVMKRLDAAIARLEETTHPKGA